MAVKISTVVFWVVKLCGLVGFGETLVTTYKITRRHNPEDHHWHDLKPF
jgi:hypothetical protein